MTAERVERLARQIVRHRVVKPFVRDNGEAWEVCCRCGEAFTGNSHEEAFRGHAAHLASVLAGEFEQTLDRLRETNRDYSQRAVKAEAKVERVEALIAKWADDRKTYPIEVNENARYAEKAVEICQRELRAALDGDTGGGA